MVSGESVRARTLMSSIVAPQPAAEQTMIIEPVETAWNRDGE